MLQHRPWQIRNANNVHQADIFLLDRSGQGLEYNAIVAVLYVYSCVPRQETVTIDILHSLRHAEYYRGVLFLTSDRDTVGQIFLSRSHVALRYRELEIQAKTRIWHAFFKRSGMAEGRISDELVKTLAQRVKNGRQIKHACRTATLLARNQGVEIQYEHLKRALDAGDVNSYS